MAELGVQPPTGLYPQPPQQQSGVGALSAPQALGLLESITRNQILMQDLRGRNAVGQAYQQSIQPDGTFDQPGFNAMIRSNPDAAWMAGEAIPHALDIARSQAGNMLQQNQAAYSLLGSLPKNATDEDVRGLQTNLSRVFKGQNTAAIEAIAEKIKSLHGKARADYITQLQTGAIGPSGIAGLVSAPPSPSGAPTQQTLQERLYSGNGPQAVGQSPGEPTLQEASAAGAAALESTGPKTNQIHADLENLRQLNKDIPIQGPTAEFEKKLNQVGARLGIGVTMTRDQLAKSEEFDKIANQLSLNQSTLFHGSDAGLHTVVAANPNLGMSRYGRDGVIDMLQGNQDAVDRTRQLWFDARRRGATANSYNDFINQSSKVVDPRVFQFNRMSKENQQKFLSDMDPAELPGFEQKYKDSIAKGWVKPLKGQKQSQAEPPMAGARLAADGHWYVKQPHANGDYQRVVTGNA